MSSSWISSGFALPASLHSSLSVYSISFFYLNFPFPFYLSRTLQFQLDLHSWLVQIQTPIYTLSTLYVGHTIQSRPYWKVVCDEFSLRVSEFVQMLSMKILYGDGIDAFVNMVDNIACFNYVDINALVCWWQWWWFFFFSRICVCVYGCGVHVCSLWQLSFFLAVCWTHRIPLSMSISRKSFFVNWHARASWMWNCECTNS